jgi:hypothetical protein
MALRRSRQPNRSSIAGRTKRGEPKTPEQFDEAYAGTASTAQGTKKIVVGFSYGSERGKTLTGSSYGQTSRFRTSIPASELHKLLDGTWAQKKVCA